MKARQENWLQPVFIIGLGLILLITEVVGLKFDHSGLTVSAMAIEAVGAFTFAQWVCADLCFGFFAGACVGAICALIGASLSAVMGLPSLLIMPLAALFTFLSGWWYRNA